MAKADYITLKHSFGKELRSRTMDLKDGGITTFDKNGAVLAKNFSLRIIGSAMVQPDKSKAPYGEVTVKVTKATDTGSTNFSVTSRTLTLLEHFPEFLRDALGGYGPIATPKWPESPYAVQFDETAINEDKLLLAVMAASTAESEHLAQTYATQSWVEESGSMFYEGQLCCNAPVEISREYTDPNGIKLYRLRVPSLERPGFWNFSSANLADLTAGNYKFPERTVSVQNSFKAASGIMDRWSALTPGEKVSQEHEERTQPIREQQQRLDSQFGFRSSEGR